MWTCFVPCFTSPTCETFIAVAIGWTLRLGRPTVVRVVACAACYRDAVRSTPLQKVIREAKGLPGFDEVMHP